MYTGVVPPQPIVVLRNMVTATELADPEEYKEISEDVKEEMTTFGTVKSFLMPKPGDACLQSEVGKIFVEFETTQMAIAAVTAVSGRKFGGRTILTDYMPPEAYAQTKALSGVV
jgi:splicing factor U2AF subunit